MVANTPAMSGPDRPVTAGPPAAAFANILVAVDDSAQAEHALALAERLARDEGAGVSLVHVVVPLPPIAGAEYVVFDTDAYNAHLESGRRLLSRARERLPASVPIKTVLAEGDPAAEIVRVANQVAADLIVIGTHARGHVARAILGSVADGVMRHAPCPVLTVAHPCARRGGASSGTPSDEAGANS